MKKLCTLILFVLSGMLYAQNQTVTGVVVDGDGVPLAGATVVVQGTSVGVIADLDGKFSINVPSPVDSKVLMVSFIGFKEKLVPVGSQRQFNIGLESDVEGLDEVIVVGYGSVRKSDLTGSVSSVKAEEVAKTGFIAIDQALAGRAAGVVVTQNSGQPGSGASITVRGISSLSGSQPLYVIDGIPIDNSSEEGLNNEGLGSGDLNPLSLINPADISSIEILKDASATAIYGSRGANGVVLVTTKSGLEGKGTLSVEYETMITAVPDYIEVMDANQYWLNRNEALLNGGGELPRETLIDSARAGIIPTQNWQEVIFRQAFSQNANVSFSGGNKDIRYLISGNILDADGTIIKTDFSRAQGRLNLDANVTDKLSVGTNITYSSVSSSTQSTNSSIFVNNGTSSVVRRAVNSNPSTLFIDPDEDEDEQGQITPLTYIENNTWGSTMNQFLGSVYANWQITDALSFRTTFTYQNRITKLRFYQNNLENVGIILNNNRRGWARTNDAESLNTTNTNQLTYTNTFGKHNLTVDLGQSLEWRSNEALRTSNYGYANDLLTYFAPNTATFFDPDIVTYRDSKLASFFGRLRYSFNNKLLVTLTGRYDGSSKFAVNNKWAFFPAGSIAYKLSEEKFLKDIDAVSLAKLRLSYGIVGNQAVREYQSLSQLEASQFTFGTGSDEALSTIYFTNQLANENLKWETTTQINGGLDLGLFKNKITLTADYYKKETTDLLIENNDTPAQSGFEGITENFGEIESEGFEIGLNAVVVDTDKFKWNFSGNVSSNKAIITNLSIDFVQSGITFGQVTSGTQRLIIGEEIGTFWGWQRAGVAQFDDFVEFQGLTSQEQIDLYNQDRTATFTYVDGYEGGYPVNAALHRPGEQLYEDLDGDMILSESDKQAIGSPQPDVIFGMTNSFQIGNFDLSFFMDAQFGQEIANVGSWNLLNYGGGQQLAKVLYEQWTPENQSTIHPKVTTNSGTSAVPFSDRHVEDASFIRLQNVTIGYRFPQDLLYKLKISDLRIYASGSNLLTITDYTGYNPDVNLGGNNNLTIGHDNSAYPVSRLFRLGVSLKF